MHLLLLSALGAGGSPNQKRPISMVRAFTSTGLMGRRLS